MSVRYVVLTLRDRDGRTYTSAGYISDPVPSGSTPDDAVDIEDLAFRSGPVDVTAIRVVSTSLTYQTATMSGGA